MKITKTAIEGLVIIEPKKHGDSRGYFFESYNKELFDSKVMKIDFVQDNESRSSFGVLRGLHFQKPPFAQAKLVRCLEGKVLDVAVDLRPNSKTYKQYVAVELSAENKKQFFIPEGFAHGFVVLSEFATFCYKVNKFYNPEADSGIAYNDSEINVDWKIDDKHIKLSDKDKKQPQINDIINPFA